VALGSLVISSLVSAQTVNVTITGTIDDVVCTPSLTGTGVSGTTITLPKVDITQLDTTGKTAGSRTVTFSVSNCGASMAVNNMWVHFSGSTVDSNGRLQPTSGTGNIRFELLNGSGGAVIKAGGSVPSGAPNSSGAD